MNPGTWFSLLRATHCWTLQTYVQRTKCYKSLNYFELFSDTLSVSAFIVPSENHAFFRRVEDRRAYILLPVEALLASLYF